MTKIRKCFDTGEIYMARIIIPKELCKVRTGFYQVKYMNIINKSCMDKVEQYLFVIAKRSISGLNE